MIIREAKYEDATKLKRLQGECIAGTGLSVITVNEPDFFLRTKIYKNVKVFLACEGDNIIGTISGAIRKTTINGVESKIGYVFQMFVSPKLRRKGIARKLLEYVQSYLVDNGADFLYALVMEENSPSMKCFESSGFFNKKVFANPYILVYKEMLIKEKNKTFCSMEEADLEKVCSLMNEMWKGYELFTDYTVDTLRKEIESIPEFSISDIKVLKENEEILACLALWDWSKVTKVTVESLSRKLECLGIMLDIGRKFIKLPRAVKVGEQLKQLCVIYYAYKSAEDFEILLRHVNNYALAKGIDQICLLCDKDEPIFKTMKKFFLVNVGSQLYVKVLNKNKSIDSNKIWINGVDI